MSSEVRRGLLFVISAPSGTGKTTVVERLVQVVPDLSLSRSYTSRGLRAGECDGIDYNFITRARFESMQTMVLSRPGFHVCGDCSTRS